MRGFVLTAMFMAHGVTTAAAQETERSAAAFLFGYQPHRGEELAFHEGYRAHLDWHRSNNDSLIWYGWEVITGERLGVFVDGTFGRPFVAFDRRVDPRGDALDFQQTAGPYADALFRTAWVLRFDLSTGTPLEAGNPTRLVEVITYELNPGSERRFESIIGEFKIELLRRGNAPDLTWYQLVNGGSHSTYMLLVHRTGMGNWDTQRIDMTSVLSATTMRVFDEVVRDVDGELWTYLPGSSLIPSR